MINTQPLEIPSQFANLMGMGAPQAVFKGKLSLWTRIILISILGLIGIGALGYALLLLWERWGRYYPPAIFQAMLPYLVATLITFGVDVLLLWELYKRRKQAVVVYSSGFAASDRKGVTTWRWDQIIEVYANVVRHYTNGISTGTTHTYTLKNNQAEKIVFNDSITDVEELYNLIQNNTLQIRYQKLANEYNAGYYVTFGPVRINKEDGLQIGKKTYPWNEIEQVGINKGVLSVKKKDGGWFSGAKATSGTIPNLHVLLSILDQVIGLKTG